MKSILSNVSKLHLIPPIRSQVGILGEKKQCRFLLWLMQWLEGIPCSRTDQYGRYQIVLEMMEARARGRGG